MRAIAGMDVVIVGISVVYGDTVNDFGSERRAEVDGFGDIKIHAAQGGAIPSLRDHVITAEDGSDLKRGGRAGTSATGRSERGENRGPTVAAHGDDGVFGDGNAVAAVHGDSQPGIQQARQ